MTNEALENLSANIISALYSNGHDSVLKFQKCKAEVLSQYEKGTLQETLRKLFKNSEPIRNETSKDQLEAHVTGWWNSLSRVDQYDVFKECGSVMSSKGQHSFLKSLFNHWCSYGLTSKQIFTLWNMHQRYLSTLTS